MKLFNWHDMRPVPAGLHHNLRTRASTPLRRRLSQLQGVREIHSSVALTEIKCTTELPLAVAGI
jgi:hypothetical protein